MGVVEGATLDVSGERGNDDCASEMKSLRMSPKSLCDEIRTSAGIDGSSLAFAVVTETKNKET